MRTLRRRKPVVAAISAAASVLVLAGCSNGFDAANIVQGDAAFGSTLKTDSTVEVHNVMIIDAPDAEPQVIGTIVNESGTSDTLVGVTVGEEATAVQLTGAEGETIPVPNRSLVVFAGEEGPQLTLPGAELTMGSWVPVTFHFETGGEASGDVIVLDQPVV